ncbi:hypothetical protein wTpre_852 [Wolbachia endosymbiont of Trichogramma pretiosum]|nr:hypothetical protein wTpre_852 [Wolbachia endosymbiont of Trichogramma pretiosum]
MPFSFGKFLILVTKASGQHLMLESRNLLSTKVMIGFCW